MSRKRKGDWRLPTKEELLVLYDKYIQSGKRVGNKIYWSSTKLDSYANYAWGVGFFYGGTYYFGKTATNFVRCVRDTKNGLEWSKTADEKMTWDEAVAYAKDMNKETT